MAAEDDEEMKPGYPYAKVFVGTLTVLFLIFAIDALGYGAAFLFLACGMASIDLDKK